MTKSQAKWALYFLVVIALYASGLGQAFDRTYGLYICQVVSIWPGCSDATENATAETPIESAAAITDFKWRADPNFGSGGAIVWDVYVKNETSRYIRNVRVRLLSYDARGKIVSNSDTYVVAIPPGETRMQTSYAELYKTEKDAKAEITEIHYEKN